MADLSRFVEAQEGTYPGALAELRAGAKRGHWMWFVLPQLQGLGSSPTARYYALTGVEEARAYAEDPVLGPRLLECCRALLALPGDVTAQQVLGGVDALKLRSCLTLFARACPREDAFRQVLDRFYDGIEDERTLALLGEAGDA